MYNKNYQQREPAQSMQQIEGEVEREGGREKERDRERVKKPNAEKIFVFISICKLERHVRLLAMFIQYVLAAGCLSFFLSWDISLFFLCLWPTIPCDSQQSNIVSTQVSDCVCVRLGSFCSFSVEPFSGPVFNSACN